MRLRSVSGLVHRRPRARRPLRLAPLLNVAHCAWLHPLCLAPTAVLICHNQHTKFPNESKKGDEWDYIEEGPAEIIWQGNEIIVKKKKVKVAKRSSSNPRPNEEFTDPHQIHFLHSLQLLLHTRMSVTAQEVLESVAQQIPNFGTEKINLFVPFTLRLEHVDLGHAAVEFTFILTSPAYCL